MKTVKMRHAVHVVICMSLSLSVALASCGPSAIEPVTTDVGTTPPATRSTAPTTGAPLGAATPASLPTAATPSEARFDGQRAFESVVAQVAYGPRIPGTEAHRLTGDWIQARLTSAGWRVEVQPIEYRGVALRNVVARSSEGEGPWIILGAHYDTRPTADRDLLAPDQPVPGANDGASGVAVLLELARVLSPSRSTPEVWLVFFDGEDQGRVDDWEWFIGSRHFARSLRRVPQSVIVVDMVGDADLQLYYEVNSDRELAASIWQVGIGLGYPAFFPEERHAILDDHTPFLEVGIPAALVIDFDYPAWHTTQDTPERVAPHSLEQVGRTLQAWLRTLN